MSNADLKVTALDFAYKLEQKDAATALEQAKIIYEWLAEPEDKYVEMVDGTKVKVK